MRLLKSILILLHVILFRKKVTDLEVWIILNNWTSAFIVEIQTELIFGQEVDQMILGLLTAFQLEVFLVEF